MLDDGNLDPHADLVELIKVLDEALDEAAVSGCVPEEEVRRSIDALRARKTRHVLAAQTRRVVTDHG